MGAEKEKHVSYFCGKCKWTGEAYELSSNADVSGGCPICWNKYYRYIPAHEVLSDKAPQGKMAKKYVWQAKGNLHKFKHEKFTFIRGVGAAEKFKAGDVIKIINNETKGGICKAKIVSIGVMAVSFIPLSVVQRDSESAYFCPRTKKEYFGWLNSERQYNKLTDLDQEVSIFFLEKINKKEKLA